MTSEIDFVHLQKLLADWRTTALAQGVRPKKIQECAGFTGRTVQRWSTGETPIGAAMLDPIERLVNECDRNNPSLTTYQDEIRQEIERLRKRSAAVLVLPRPRLSTVSLHTVESYVHAVADKAQPLAMRWAGVTQQSALPVLEKVIERFKRSRDLQVERPLTIDVSMISRVFAEEVSAKQPTAELDRLVADQRESENRFRELCEDLGGKASSGISLTVRQFDHRPFMHGLSVNRERLFLALTPPSFGGKNLHFQYLQIPADEQSERSALVESDSEALWGLPAHPWNWFHAWFDTAPVVLSNGQAR